MAMENIDTEMKQIDIKSVLVIGRAAFELDKEIDKYRFFVTIAGKYKNGETFRMKTRISSWDKLNEMKIAAGYKTL